jgi:transcriptional regulator with XRE-family HTH domain
MAKKFSELVAKMSPESQEKARKKADAMLTEMALDDLRTSLSMTQEQLASQLGVKQSSLSKILHSQNMYINTLDKLVKAMGGDLELHVAFYDGRVKLSLEQFRSALTNGSKKSPRKSAKQKSNVRKAG